MVAAMSTTGSPLYPWHELLRTADTKFLEDEGGLSPAVEVTRERLRSGMTGVSEAEIKRHEESLGSSLPPSYRQFLKVANGWDAMEDPPVYLVPLTKAGWLRDLDPHLVAMWSDEDDPYPEVS